MHSKIMTYSHKDLIFTNIILQKDEKGYICELPETTFRVFKKLGLNCAPWSRIGFFTDLYSLFDGVYNIFDNLASGKQGFTIEIFHTFVSL